MRFLPGAPITGMWFNPNSRGSRLRIWQPWGCKSLHAHQPSPASARQAGVWFIGNSKPIRLKIEQPWECKSPHADQFGMSTGRARRTCLLNSGLPEKGVWCESTAFRHFGSEKAKGRRFLQAPSRFASAFLILPSSWSRSHSRPAPGFYPDTVRLQLPPAPPIHCRVV